MPRQAAAPKAKEALTSKAERPHTPETADTNEEVRRAEATDPESDLEAEKKKRRAAAAAPKRSKSGPKEKPKPKKGATKDAPSVESAEETEDPTTAAEPAPTTKAQTVTSKKSDHDAGKKSEVEGSKKAAAEASEGKSRKRQAETDAAAAAPKPTKKRRGSDAEGEDATKANSKPAPKEETTKAVAKPKKSKADAPTQAAEQPESSATEAKKVKKQKSVTDQPKAEKDKEAATVAKPKKAAQSKAVPDTSDPPKQPKKVGRKGSVASVEGTDDASSKPVADQVGEVDAGKPKKAGRKASLSSVELSNAPKEESKKSKKASRKNSVTSTEVVDEAVATKTEGLKRKGSVTSQDDSELGGKKAGKKKSSAKGDEVTSSKRRQSLEAVDEEPTGAKRKRAAPKASKSSEEKSTEMTAVEEPAQKKKRGPKKAEEEEPEVAEKKSKKRPNQESSPVAKKAKYDPHVDGKGPALDDNWEEQLKEVESVEGELKIATWNVNGIRSVLKKPKNATTEYEGDLQAYLAVECPDVLCLNEVKADDEVFSSLLEHFPEYHAELVHSDKKGYAGVAILVRKTDGLHEKIESKIEGIGEEEHDSEGRTLTLVFPGCCVVASYVANAGQGLKRLDYRIEKYDKALHAFLNGLKEKYARPVIWCGDLNVAYEEIDIWDSKHNQKSAGHTPQERASFGAFLQDGSWIDIWRKQNPETRRYTFWPTRSTRSRVDNLGWRLDYFIITKELEDSVTGAHIRDKFKGSDHCPILLTVKRAALFDKL